VICSFRRPGARVEVSGCSCSHSHAHSHLDKAIRTDDGRRVGAEPWEVIGSKGRNEWMSRQLDLLDLSGLFHIFPPPTPCSRPPSPSTISSHPIPSHSLALSLTMRALLSAAAHVPHELGLGGKKTSYSACTSPPTVTSPSHQSPQSSGRSPISSSYFISHQCCRRAGRRHVCARRPPLQTGSRHCIGRRSNSLQPVSLRTACGVSAARHNWPAMARMEGPSLSRCDGLAPTAVSLAVRERARGLCNPGGSGDWVKWVDSTEMDARNPRCRVCWSNALWWFAGSLSVPLSWLLTRGCWL
jgi:hypothetical protein